MNKKNTIIGIFFIACGLANINAQTGNSSSGNVPITEKINMSNFGNEDGTYYLLLCKLQPNVSSKMLGTFSLESATKDSTCHFCNICKIEVNVSSIDNKMVINNLCNGLNVSMVTAQYKGDAFFAVELVGIMNIADISFTGIAENKSLLLVNENAVTVNNNSRSGALASAGDLWQESTNGSIYYNEGNVGIGVMFPSEKLDVNGKILVRALDGINYWYNSYLQWNGHSLIMGNPINSYAHNSVDLKPGGSNISSIYSQLRLYTATNVNQHVLKVQINSESTTFFNGGNVGIGTTTPAHKLTVSGTIGAREIIVDANMGADFVFAPNYPLRPLSEVEQFITANKHLPDIAPADTMIQYGVNMGEFQIQLLQKIEELTLYVIEQQKQIEAQQEAYQSQSIVIEELKNEIENLKK